MALEELRITLTNGHGGTAELHVNELASTDHGEAERRHTRACEATASPTLTKRERKRHDGTA
jgi:hypothetical protein